MQINTAVKTLLIRIQIDKVDNRLQENIKFSLEQLEILSFC